MDQSTSNDESLDANGKYELTFGTGRKLKERTVPQEFMITSAVMDREIGNAKQSCLILKYIVSRPENPNYENNCITTA